MPKNLIITGGPSHPFEETAPQLAELLGECGFDSDVSFDIEGSLARFADGGYDLLTVHCLRWSMTQHEKYEPLRAQWAFSLSEKSRRTIAGHVARGGGLFGIHTAPISFDDWPEWADLLGVAWRWNTSYHPPLGPLQVRSRSALEPLGLDCAFTVVDEFYSNLEIKPWMKPFMEALHPEGGDWRPIAVAGEQNGARRVFCGLGHEAASFAQADNRRLICRAARWLTRQPVS